MSSLFSSLSQFKQCLERSTETKFTFQASTGEDFESDRKTPELSGQVTPQNTSYSTLFEGLSWADEIDLEEQVQFVEFLT
jgi:hypothetical protein